VRKRRNEWEDEEDSQSETNTAGWYWRSKKSTQYMQEVDIQSNAKLVETCRHLLGSEQRAGGLKVDPCCLLMLPSTSKLHVRYVLCAEKIGSGTAVPQGVRHIRCVPNSKDGACVLHECAKTSRRKPGEDERVLCLVW